MLDSKDARRELSPRKIRSRKWVSGAGKGKVQRVVQLYQVSGSQEWFSLNELSSRTK